MGPQMNPSDEIIIGRKYQHKKTGKIVKVLSYEMHRVRLEHASGRITVQNNDSFIYDYNLLPLDIERDGMLNKGLHQNRFKSNPLEEIYAMAWDLKNTPAPGSPIGLLDYILAKDNNCPAGEVSDRDREVTATIIQWLGSPVGQNFISECQAKGQKS